MDDRQRRATEQFFQGGYRSRQDYSSYSADDLKPFFDEGYRAQLIENNTAWVMFDPSRQRGPGNDTSVSTEAIESLKASAYIHKVGASWRRNAA